jgi:tetratricopeptide (TPR) repeat protein
MPWNVTPSQDEIAFLMEAGLIYRDSGRPADAKVVFQGVRALAPSSDVPEIALGTLAFVAGDFETAIGHYKNAIQLNAKSGLAHAHLGEAYLFREDFENARMHLNRAMELDPRRESAGKFAKGVLDVLEHVRKELAASKQPVP